jgi:hypothetical protein
MHASSRKIGDHVGAMATSDDDDETRTPGSGRDVISSLPRHRPHRRSAKRDAKAKPAAKPGTTAAKPKTAARSAAKPKAAAKPSTAKDPAGRRASAARTPREKIGATAGAKTRDAETRAAQRPPRARPAADKPAGPPSGTELIGTAVQAAGELAQIGLKLGSQAVKNAGGRLPKPSRPGAREGPRWELWATRCTGHVAPWGRRSLS